jgi:hypothetical protein
MMAPVLKNSFINTKPSRNDAIFHIRHVAHFLIAREALSHHFGPKATLTPRAQFLQPPLRHDFNLFCWPYSSIYRQMEKQFSPGKVQGDLPAIAISPLKPEAEFEIQEITVLCRTE